MPSCPVHKREYESDPLWPQILACPEPGCDRGTTVNAGTRECQQKLPGLDPGKQSTKIKTLEKPLQTDCVTGLRNRGFSVILMGQGRPPVNCPHCRKWHTPTGPVGNKTGYPDMSIRHPSWPRAVVLLVEMKGTDTKVEAEQKKLNAEGWSFICWTWKDVWAVVEATHLRLKNSAGDTPTLEYTEQATP